MARPAKDLTAGRLRELLDYNPATGLFVWQSNHRGHVRHGTKVEGKTARGYVIVKIDQRRYMAHRLAWLYVHGEWPQNEIDHVNGVRHDNRISNLRDVSTRVNRENRRTARQSSSTGLLGVTFIRMADGTKKFVPQITAEGKVRRLGRFDTPEEAHAVYLAAKRVLHEGCTI